MTNLFAFRATDPDDMKAQDDPVGPENDEALRFFMANAGRVVFAWGNHGSHMDRCFKFIDSTRDIQASTYFLEKTKAAQPKHPLYIRADTVPTFEKIWS